MQARVVLAVLTTGIMALPIGVSAQEATLIGQVADTTGAVLPGVVVRAIHEATGTATEVAYERKRARQLVYQNMILRREAVTAGEAQIASLLENLEPILLDIANLPDKPDSDDVRVIRERVEKKNIVALLQVNSAALARALD